MSSPVRLAVLGAGNRGTAYARWAAAHPDRATVVAIAEPRDARRASFAATYHLGPEAVHADWREVAAGPRIADAVLICTQDRMHVEPALAFAEQGYHILLEKPMALSEEECRRIASALQGAGVVCAIGHVLRYTPYTALVKSIVDSGRIGDVVSVQHLEPVGFWHQAHSFVRGNWSRSDLAAFMLMSKSCHDVDWLGYVMGSPIARVSSFGRLSHFRASQRPDGAGDRCVDCGLERSCAYSAVRLYGEQLARGEHRWPLDVVVDEFTTDALDAALRTGPYGRCVYASDNDVVDHQVVAMEFASGATGTFTMTGFTEAAHRRTRMFGTRGELVGDGESVSVYDFLTRSTEVLDARTAGDATAGGGHGGGDGGLMAAFVEAVRTGDTSAVVSGPTASLASHLAVFAAERARVAGTVETVSTT